MYKAIAVKEKFVEDVLNRKLSFGDVIGIVNSSSIYVSMYLGTERVLYKREEEGEILEYDGCCEYLPLEEWVLDSIVSKDTIYVQRMLSYKKSRVIKLNVEHLPEEKKKIYNKLFNLIKNRKWQYKK